MELFSIRIQRTFQLVSTFNNERKEETEEKTEGTVSNPGTSWSRDSLVIVRPPVSKSEKASLCE